MLAERRPEITDLLPEEITIEAELASAPFSQVLERAYEELDKELYRTGSSAEFEQLQRDWGRKLLSWWNLNIHSGAVKVEYIGDGLDGQWICTYKNPEQHRIDSGFYQIEREEAELKIRMTNGFIDSPEITSKVEGKDWQDDKNWAVGFNNDWVESIRQEVTCKDPLGQTSSIRKILEIYHGLPQFRTKPIPSTP